MEKQELAYIGRYAKRLNDAAGDVGMLTKDERRHLAMLLRKYELEQALAKLAEDLTQLPMTGLEEE